MWKDGEYIGIVTEGDISQRVIAQIKKPIEVRAESIMSTPVISIESNKLMAAAFLIMEKNGIRHIAVSENEKIIGMLSIRDFSKYYVRKFSKRKKWPSTKPEPPICWNRFLAIRYWSFNGTPGWIRTSDPRIRSPFIALLLTIFISSPILPAWYV